MYKDFFNLVRKNSIWCFFLLALLTQYFIKAFIGFNIFYGEIEVNIFLLVLAWILASLLVKIIDSKRACCLAKILIVSFFLLRYLWTVSRFNPESLVTFFDYSLHYNNAKASFAHISSWGYSPFFGAGELSQVFIGFDAHIPSTFFKLFNNTSIELYYLVTALTFLAIPLVYIASIKFLNISYRQTQILFMFIMAFHLAPASSGDSYFSYELGLAKYFSVNSLNFTFLNKLLYFGLTAYVLSLALAMLARSIFLRVRTSNSYIRWLNVFWLHCVCIIGLWVHPLFWPIFLLSSSAEIFNIYNEKSIFRDGSILASCVIFSFGLNWSWLKALFSFRGMLDYPFPSLVLQTEPLIMLKSMFMSPLFLSVFVAAFLLLSSIKERKQFLKALPHISIISFLFILVLLGSQLGFSKLEPLRFTIWFVVYFFFATMTIEKQIPKRKESLLLKISIFTIVLSMLASYSESQSIKHDMPQEHELFMIKESINKNINKNERILIQQIDSWKIKPDLGYFNTRLQEHYRELFLNPSYPLPHTSQVSTSFWYNRFLGKELSDLSIDEVNGLLDLYNVAVLILVDDDAKMVFESHKDHFEEILKTKNYIVLKRVVSKSSLFLVGEGSVSDLKLDRISLSDVENENIVLKMHYFEGLTATDSNVEIYPVYISDRPLPFIGLKNKLRQKNIEIIYDSKSVKSPKLSFK